MWKQLLWEGLQPRGHELSGLKPLAVTMASVLDHAHAGHFDIAHHVRVAAEDPAVEHVMRRRAGQDRCLRIQHDAVDRV